MKNRAWKYCRQASPDEGLTGLNMQSRIIDQYIAEHELALVGETKAVESGNSMDRESIREIRTKAEGGAYDILLISGLDRLGRDMQQTTALVRDLLRIDIHIVPVMANEEITEKDCTMELWKTAIPPMENRHSQAMEK